MKGKRYLAVFVALAIILASVFVITTVINKPKECDNCLVNNDTLVNVTVVTTKNTTATKTVQVNATTRDRMNTHLLYFHQDNCPYCEQMAPVIAQLVKEKYNVTQVNLTCDPNGRALVVKYGLTSVPTLIMTNSKTHKDLTLNGVYTHGMVIEDIASIGG